MKRIMDTLLRTGYSATRKYGARDICRKLPVLEDIIRDVGEGGGVCIKGNAFWSRENTARREELRRDIRSVRRFEISDKSCFRVINRYANGDRYGIERGA